MSTRWLKLDARVLENRKLVAASRRAGSGCTGYAWIGILSLHAEYGDGGVIPLEFSDDYTVRRSMGYFSECCDDEEVAEIMASLDSVGLARRAKCGRLCLPGFDREWMGKCTSCKQLKVTNPRSTRCHGCKAKDVKSYTFPPSLESMKFRDPAEFRISQDPRSRGDWGQQSKKEREREISAPSGSVHAEKSHPSIPSEGDGYSTAVLAIFAEAQFANLLPAAARTAKVDELRAAGVTVAQVAGTWAQCQSADKPGAAFASRMKDPTTIASKWMDGISQMSQSQKEPPIPEPPPESQIKRGTNRPGSTIIYGSSEHDPALRSGLSGGAQVEPNPNDGWEGIDRPKPTGKRTGALRALTGKSFRITDDERENGTTKTEPPDLGAMFGEPKE